MSGRHHRLFMRASICSIESIGNFHVEVGGRSWEDGERLEAVTQIFPRISSTETGDCYHLLDFWGNTQTIKMTRFLTIATIAEIFSDAFTASATLQESLFYSSPLLLTTHQSRTCSLFAIHFMISEKNLGLRLTKSTLVSVGVPVHKYQDINGYYKTLACR